MTENRVARFFDTLTDEYTATIERCFPRYREMLWALLNYLPQGRLFESILELGCGTGNLSVLLHEAYPDARLRLVDVSGESLDACRTRLSAAETIEFEQQDFRNLTYSPGRFDLIISNISIHHLSSSEKQKLFQECHGWLTGNGVFFCETTHTSGVSRRALHRHRDVQGWSEIARLRAPPLDNLAKAVIRHGLGPRQPPLR